MLVYQEVELFNKGQGKEPSEAAASREIVTICIDEKPGVQAIVNTAPDLPLVPFGQPSISRDHEYVRHGTASILAGIDFHDGHVFVQVHRRHRSCEFIRLLQGIDGYYEEGVKIRIIYPSDFKKPVLKLENYR